MSVFFREHNKALHEHAVGELGGYAGVTIGAARSHCKVTLFDLGPGDGLVFVESHRLLKKLARNITSPESVFAKLRMQR